MKMYRTNQRKTSKVTITYHMHDADAMPLLAESFKNFGSVQISTYNVETIKVRTVETQTFERRYHAGAASLEDM